LHHGCGVVEDLVVPAISGTRVGDVWWHEVDNVADAVVRLRGKKGIERARGRRNDVAADGPCRGTALRTRGAAAGGFGTITNQEVEPTAIHDHEPDVGAAIHRGGELRRNECRDPTGSERRTRDRIISELARGRVERRESRLKSRGNSTGDVAVSDE